MERTWVRRPVMVLGVVSMAALLLVLTPVWLPVLLLVDAARLNWRFPLVRFTAFGLLWAWLETLGIVGAVVLWLIGQSRNQNANFVLQKLWTRGVVGALGLTVGLHIEVEGADTLGDGPFIALCRHASLADSVMSAWVFMTASGLRPRYVLKKELKLDPCLDVVGHRLPNYFLDRSSSNLASELQGIEQMAQGLTAKEIAVIFPEGTRANDVKRRRILERLRERSPERAVRLEKLKYLMAPKTAGVTALLAAVPNAKVVTMWHAGFDGMDSFRGIVQHLAKSAVRVQVKVTEHQRATVATGEAFVAWLDEQWCVMDQAVSEIISEQSLAIGVNNG
jgi:1-acyl-sn-glycerol-3-phosphate acyltransferase